MNRSARLTLTLTALLTLGMMAGQLLAADDAKPKRERPANAEAKGDRRGGPGARDGFGRGDGFLQKALADLKLSDQQKTDIKKILDDAKQAVQARMEEKKAEFQKLREEFQAARENKDRQKFQEIMKKRQELMAGLPTPKDIMDKVRAVLTDEQKTQLDGKLKEARERAEKARAEGAAKRGEGDKPRKRPDKNDQK